MHHINCVEFGLINFDDFTVAISFASIAMFIWLIDHARVQLSSIEVDAST